MKKSILFIMAICLACLAHAQAPQAVNYQAVVRDAQGMVIPNQAVAFQLSVLETNSSGPAVYVETHNLTTNAFGLANLQLGTGSLVSGNFSTINWGAGSHFLKVELDETGGSNYALMGTSQLISVPYALHAQTVENDQVDDADADPLNETNTSLSLNGTTLELTDAAGTLSANLSSLQDGVNDADADPLNETNTSLILNGTTLELTDSAGTLSANLSSLQDGVNDADADSTNELNTGAALVNDTLEITDGGGTLKVDLSALNDNDWVRDGNHLYVLNDSVAIGTNEVEAVFSVGGNPGIFNWYHLDSLPNQVWIGGEINSPTESQNLVKLMIGGYDNDGSDVYPIAAMDENGYLDFYLKGRTSSSGIPSAYFAGLVEVNTLLGGTDDTLDAGADYSAIVGGRTNRVSSDYSSVGGGRDNLVARSYGTIAGGRENTVDSSSYGGILSGRENHNSGIYSGIVVGWRNEIRSTAGHGFIGGGFENTLTDKAYATIAGGYRNYVSGQRGAILGGVNNVVAGLASVVVGGDSNKVFAEQAGILGGLDNEVHGLRSSISGGRNNYIGPDQSGFLGWYSHIGNGLNDTIAGGYSCIPGGRDCYVGGQYSFATGRTARVVHNGSFVFADNNSLPFETTVENQFRIRARGGAEFVTAINSSGAATAGVSLAAGSGSWSSLSDRNAKENFQALDVRSILKKVAALELSNWNYKTQADDVRHMGPMAQDFHAAFGLGEANTRINTVDADGVALAAIQGLYEEMQEKNQLLEEELSSLKAEMKTLRELVLGSSEEGPVGRPGRKRLPSQEDAAELEAPALLEGAGE